MYAGPLYQGVKDQEILKLILLNGLRFRPCRFYWQEEDPCDGLLPNWLYELRKKILKKISTDLEVEIPTSSPQQLANRAFISCWSQKPNGDFWNKYAPPPHGLLLKSNLELFSETLLRSIDEKGFCKTFGPVQYRNLFGATPKDSERWEKEAKNKLDSCSADFFGFAFLKQEEFYFENEYRFLVDVPEKIKLSEALLVKAGKLFFDEILVRTDSPKGYREEIEFILKKNGFEKITVGFQQ